MNTNDYLPPIAIGLACFSFIGIVLYFRVSDLKRNEERQHRCGSLYNRYGDQCYSPREKCTELAKDLFTNIHQKNTNTANTDQYTQNVNQYIENCISEYKQ